MRLLLAFVFASTVAFAGEPAKIGDAIPNLGFTDTRSLARTLDDLAAKKPIVIAFVDTACPLAQRYLPVLKNLSEEFGGVQFLALNPTESDTVVATALQAVKMDIHFPFGKDFGGACAQSLGVTRTPEVVLIDADRKLRYRGRIDDQYRIGGTRKEPTARNLKAAISAVLAAKEVTTPTTEVDGCPITFPTATKPKAVNFAEHIAPLMKAHCWQCHTTNGSGPFPLVTFKEVSSRAKAVAEAVALQRMPPWFTTHDFGPFTNRRGMTDEERAAIRDWVKLGMPEGEAAKVPATPKPPENKWTIGTPDKVLKTFEFQLPAQGDIPYKYAVLPTIFTEDTWVKGFQILPDNPRVLHHCNMAFVKVNEKFNEDANFITGYVPGGEAAMCEEGVAILVPAGSLLMLQMHFVSTGAPEKCTVSVGMRYPREIVKQRLQNHQITDRRFVIPAGAPAHKVAKTYTIDREVLGVGLFSHMHVRGKDMSFIAHLPDGKDETLLIVPNYNFEWQVPYRWEPGKKTFPKGTKLECIAHFDNSAFNPFNPDPKATVKFGLQTHNEMMIGFFFYTDASENLNLKIDIKNGHTVK